MSGKLSTGAAASPLCRALLKAPSEAVVAAELADTVESCAAFVEPALDTLHIKACPGRMQYGRGSPCP